MPKNFGRLAAILFLFAAFSCFLTAAAGSADERATRLIVGGLIVVLAGVVWFFDTFLGVEKSQPKIVQLQEPVKIIGVSMRTGLKSIFKDAPKLGQEYRKIKDANLITSKREPWAFVAVSKDFEGTESWEYLMGDVVTCLENVPSGLKSFEIPPLTCAVFPVRPRNKFAWGLTIGLTKKYIFTEWLPNSTYEADNSIVGDFEYHDERSLAVHPEIDLYVPIREKTQK